MFSVADTVAECICATLCQFQHGSWQFCKGGFAADKTIEQWVIE
jgi:hypothetical protein